MQSIDVADFAASHAARDKLFQSFSNSKRIVAITGAGISVSAGIPDFRSAGGLYEQVRLKYAPQKTNIKGKDFFDVNFFLQSDTRPLFYQFIAELQESCSQALPTKTHQFLKALADCGKLCRLYTQNIDCLEERTGLACWNSRDHHSLAKDLVVSLHGTLNQVACTICKVIHSLTPQYLESFRAGKEPECPSCAETASQRAALGRRRLRSGFLRPDIVLYNEPHPHGETISDFVSNDLARQPTILLVMGTSLKIPGLKKMVKDFSRAMKSRVGGDRSLVIYINKTPCSRAEWQNVFDFELIGECDRWIEHLQDAAIRPPTILSVSSVSTSAPSDPKGSKQPVSLDLPLPASPSLERRRSTSFLVQNDSSSSPSPLGKRQSKVSRTTKMIATKLVDKVAPVTVTSSANAATSATASSKAKVKVKAKDQTAPNVQTIPNVKIKRTIKPEETSTQEVSIKTSPLPIPVLRINDYFSPVKSIRSDLSAAKKSAVIKMSSKLIQQQQHQRAAVRKGTTHEAAVPEKEIEESHEHVIMPNLVI